jgi:integrase
MGDMAKTMDSTTTRSKRGHGEGSIRQRKDRGDWRGEIMLGVKPDGTSDRRYVYGKTRAAVQDKLRGLRNAQSDGTLTDPKAGRETVATFLPRWLDAIEGTIRPSTHYRYRVIVEKHLIPTIGRHRLAELRPEHVVGMLATLRAKRTTNAEGESEPTYAPRTVKYAFTAIRKALGLALDWGAVPRNVAAVVKAPRVPKVEIHPPTPAQVGTLIDVAEASGSRFASLWLVAAHSGAREGELLGLQWRDVSFEAGTISIRRTLASAKGGTPTYHEPKTTRSRRTVKLSATAVAALRAQRDRIAFDRATYAEGYAEHDLVFPSQSGGPMDASGVNHRFKEALKRAELPQTFRVHDLRHAAATAMLQAGIHPKVASERLGHASVAITLDLYSHLIEGMDADAAERIDDVFRRAV